MHDSIFTRQLFLLYDLGLYNFANMSLVHLNNRLKFDHRTIHHKVFKPEYLHSEGSST